MSISSEPSEIRTPEDCSAYIKDQIEKFLSNFPSRVDTQTCEDKSDEKILDLGNLFLCIGENSFKIMFRDKFAMDFCTTRYSVAISLIESGDSIGALLYNSQYQLGDADCHLDRVVIWSEEDTKEGNKDDYAQVVSPIRLWETFRTAVLEKVTFNEMTNPEL